MLTITSISCANQIRRNTTNTRKRPSSAYQLGITVNRLVTIYDVAHLGCSMIIGTAPFSGSNNTKLFVYQSKYNSTTHAYAGTYRYEYSTAVQDR